MAGASNHLCAHALLEIPAGRWTERSVHACQGFRKLLAEAADCLLLTCMCSQVWLAYTAGTGFIIFVNLTQKRMSPSTPRRVCRVACLAINFLVLLLLLLH